MKKILFLIFPIIILVACSHKGQPVKYGDSIHSETEGTKIINQSDTLMKRTGFNAYCRKYEIPSNLNMWIEYTDKDYETSVMNTSYAFYTQDENNTAGIADKTFIVNLNINGNDTTFSTELKEVVNKK